MLLGFRVFTIIILTGLNNCIYSSECTTTKKKQNLGASQTGDHQNEQERRLGCCQRISKKFVGALCTVTVLVLGTKIYAQEQTRLAQICDNPSSVNGFQLGSRMQVPQLKPATGPNECECWKPNLVVCGEQSHTERSLLFSTTFRAPLSTCRDRENGPVPLLQERGRTELYDKATAYGAKKTKHVLYWQEHPCGMWPTIKKIIFKND